MPRLPCTHPPVAVAIPALNEEERVAACIAALDRAAAAYHGRVDVLVFANGCRDATVERLAMLRPAHLVLHWRAASLRPGSRHAGWARRLAFDAAADLLFQPDALLLGTDADTLVAPDWIVRNAGHLAAGAAAVAGRAFTPRVERVAQGREAKRRLDLLGRYYTGLDRLRAARQAEADDPWPRHYYEGGASIATTLGWYRRIGGAPTPPLGEDRALFAAIRDAGGRVRHPVDVRVFTSCRAVGRAPGGMADCLKDWLRAEAERRPILVEAPDAIAKRLLLRRRLRDLDGAAPADHSRIAASLGLDPDSLSDETGAPLPACALIERFAADRPDVEATVPIEAASLVLREMIAREEGKSHAA